MPKPKPEKLHYWASQGSWFAEPEPRTKPKRRAKASKKKASKWW